MKPPHARLHVLLANDIRVGLVIRHGTAKSVCTLLWDRKKDKFVLGQWMRGKIDTETCDLSPGGEHFLYSASKSGMWGTPFWTVVSRTPYLKAVAYYSWRQGGGRFVSDRDYCVPGDPNPEDRESPEVRRVAATPSKNSLYVARHLCSGWTLEDLRPRFGGKLELVRQAGSGWELRHRPRGGYFLTCGELAEDTRDWEWADVDGKRLVWASKGCLWSGVMRKDGLHQTKLLHDFNGMQFEALVAPYEGGRPVQPKTITQATRPVIARKAKHPPLRKKPNRSKIRFDEDS
jgi:hypothetical protein